MTPVKSSLDPKWITTRRLGNAALQHQFYYFKFLLHQHLLGDRSLRGRHIICTLCSRKWQKQEPTFLLPGNAYHRKSDPFHSDSKREVTCLRASEGLEYLSCVWNPEAGQLVLAGCPFFSQVGEGDISSKLSLRESTEGRLYREEGAFLKKVTNTCG